MSEPNEFQIEFSSLPKVYKDGPLTELSIKSLALNVDERVRRSPVLNYIDLPDDPISKLLEAWKNHTINVPEVWESPRHYIRINGHRAEVSVYTVNPNDVEITLKYHPFLTAYFNRRKYCVLRHRSMKMKGKLKNLK